MKVAAGIVLYNPDMERFVLCLNRIIEQVERVYIFDNSSFVHDFSSYDKIVYISQKKNFGISHALNKIMEAANDDGYEWVITFDQDSIIPPKMVEKYRTAITENEDVGIVCPQVIDSRRSYMEKKTKYEAEFIDFCITSASCTSIEVWNKIGKFDEWLFIDLVDNDFCKRLVISGYKILRLNDLVLDQEFGKIIPKSEKIVNFWIRVSKILHIKNFEKLSYKKFVSPLRVYYTNRNILYLNKKMKKYGKIAYKENYNCNSYWGFIISFMLPSILRAQDKKAVIKATYNGIKEGIKIQPELWESEKYGK